LLLSLFCGAGGLDLGFESAGFKIGLAFDKKADSVNSYNLNRMRKSGCCEDVRTLDLKRLDELWGAEYAPEGVIGGPPCQSFSQANRNADDADDPRHKLPLAYAALLASLHKRNPLKFFVLENVPGLSSPNHLSRLEELEDTLREAGFLVFRGVLNARDFSTPQNRERLFLVGLNDGLFSSDAWEWPEPTTSDPSSVTVRAAIGHLPEPFFFARMADPAKFPEHPNHWCMQPKSSKFSKAGALKPGDGSHRSFKTLAWDRPSLTVAYGNREVHVHPECKRRLSVYEAMILQGFPADYRLVGTLSSQIAQVSEAVPPKMARAVAEAIASLLLGHEAKTMSAKAA